MIRISSILTSFVFFFNDTATTEIYTLSLHDALPIWAARAFARTGDQRPARPGDRRHQVRQLRPARRQEGLQRQAELRAARSEEHTSELQSLAYLVCRLLLEKKKQHVRSCRTELCSHY